MTACKVLVVDDKENMLKLFTRILVDARSIHCHSGRKQKHFVPVNCGALPPDLIESELFGHAKGSFTGAAGAKAGLFEEAQGGTIFLDEVGELPLAMQPMWS